MGFWENLDGSGKSWQAWTVTSISGGTGIRLADLDGDGDLDALAAADNEIFWVENTSGNGYSWIKHTLLNGFTARTSAVPADVNHDGRLDAVMTDEDAYAPYGNQLTWFDLTTFAPKGVLLGTILDGGATPAWGPFAWEATVPDGTALKVEVRASNAPAQLGAWVQVPRWFRSAALRAGRRRSVHRAASKSSPPLDPRESHWFGRYPNGSFRC